MSKFSSSLMDTIKKAGITPRPKWQFVALHVLMWSLLVGSVIVGSFAMSIVFHDVFDTEWDFVEIAAGSRARGVLLMIPYIWIIFLGVAVFVSSLLFKETKHGYRVRPWMIAIGAVLLSILFGVLSYASGFTERIEDRLQQNIPPYAKMREHMEEMWRAPERGILAGKITAVESDTQFTLNDPLKKTWKVTITPPLDRNELTPVGRTDQPVRRPRPPLPPKMLKLEVGKRVIMHGESAGEGEFHAFEVRPLRRGAF